MAQRKVPMAPVSYKRAGREYGNAAAAANICIGSNGKPISAETFQWYVRTGNPESNPAPKAAMVDNDTRQDMYLLKEVRAWHASRPGRGNWGGEGARARKPKDQPGEGVETPAPVAGVEPADEQETAAVLADPDAMAAIGEARAEQNAMDAATPEPTS